MKRVMFLMVILGMLCLGMSSCTAGGPGSGDLVIAKVTDDPHFSIHNDWGPAIPLQSGYANSCLIRGSEVSGRHDLCRVLRGYEEGGDPGNWVIHGGPPIYISGSNNAPYGYTVSFGDGLTYEGCWWRSPDSSYLCDYQTTRTAVVDINSGGAWTHVLRMTWDWGKYIGNTFGCASGLAGVLGGAKITLPLLTGCLDGPMPTPQIVDGSGLQPPPLIYSTESVSSGYVTS